MLETQELQDREVDSWVETKTSLIGAKGGVELDSVTTVDLWLELVIFPDNTELDDALWDGDNLKGSLVFGVLLEERGVLKGGGQL